MSPIQNTLFIHALRKAFLAPFTLLLAMFLWNCGSNTHDQGNSTPVDLSSASVTLRMEYAGIPLVDSLVLDCYGADTLHMVHDTSETAFNLELFPSDSWKFIAKLYANGELMQMGELESRISAGSTVNLSIQMHALVGFVYVEVPLGLNNSAGVASGTLVLKSDDSTYTIPMTQSATKGVFKSGMLPLDKNYDVTLSLYDKDGNEIFTLADSFELSEKSPVPELALNALRSQVMLAISTAPEKYIEVTLPLPAGYRKPGENELLITEVFAAPDSKDSSQYEFIEVFNGSIDTLILDGCSIGITSSTTTKQYALTVSNIAPSTALVIGSPNSANTPASYIVTEGWTDLGNTKGAVALKCDDKTLDSLYYANATDSLHTNVVPALGSSKYGLSAQLDIEKWELRADSSAWSLASPTPGSI